MKIEITEEQKAYLRENSVEFEDALEKNDLEALLKAIDDAIVDNIVDHNDEPDEIGIKLQRIYGQIYNQNTEG
ncbi:MAG: hypothetical protein HFE80_05420 [Clostridiaceae bacterium]|jgi:hypothetical protein|nr:hypothetical protein [Clostridiaceae bacterium]